MTHILTLTMNPALDLFTTADRVLPTHKLRCGPALVHPGGGGINVARVLRRLDAEVLALYPAGGVRGAQLHALLAAEGVPTHVKPIDGETRESFSVHEAATGQDFRFVLPGPLLSEPQWQDCLDQTVEAAAGSRLVVASGSLPPGVPEDFYARLARRLADAGARLVVDTAGPALAHALQARVYLVKPSLRELAELTGRSLETQSLRLDACRRIIDTGQAEVVALSLGEQGAMLVTAQNAWQAAALSVSVASTIGAGDSFLAGLVLGLDRGMTGGAALAQAIAASAAALLTGGTALCQPQDLRRLEPLVPVEALSY